MEVETGEHDEEYIQQDKWNHWMMTKFMLTNIFGEPNDLGKFDKADVKNGDDWSWWKW